jgi:hypothetical protein
MHGFVAKVKNPCSAVQKVFGRDKVFIIIQNRFSTLSA